MSGVSDRDVMLAPAMYCSLQQLPMQLRFAGQVAGQNVAGRQEGAFTGEISPVMLKDAGATMVILGHSERRHIFGEDNAMVNKRMLGALEIWPDPYTLCWRNA